MIFKKIQSAVFTALISSTLVVGCANTAHHESTGQFIDSTAITTKIKSKLLADKTVSSLPITVKTYKNTVQLSGFVHSYYQKERAADIALGVQGVDTVQNSIVVKPY